jgi:pimeloyl-ACP methyl ester carboxylesterase
MLLAFSLAFRQMPPVVENGREPFLDDRSSDVQVVRTPGADTVLIAFCGASHRLGMSTNLLDRWFARLGSQLIYLRDRRKIGYTGGIPVLGHDLATTVDGLRNLVRELGVRRIVALGNSAGASGALRYAKPLGVERVLALAPITGGRKYARLVAPHLPPGVLPWGDLVPLIRADIGARIRIMYGGRNAGDEQQALRLAGLPGVTVEALPEWDSHHLVGGLLRAGVLDQVLGWLVSDDDVGSDALTSPLTQVQVNATPAVQRAPR